MTEFVGFHLIYKLEIYDEVSVNYSTCQLQNAFLSVLKKKFLKNILQFKLNNFQNIFLKRIYNYFQEHY